ncbi:MAG: HRDC domain-containing protein [Verrucomicrobiota bacterium]|nr:HRDC domain-containing protein [Chthoniobacterales bacterium]MDQ3626244.1 HRDC domain-containing protein [Verrucomicrobiota bacterium]
MIATDSQLAEMLSHLAPIDRVAVDTEADSLHCYFEKLCLVQMSFGGRDYLVDPLAGVDLSPLAAALAGKEIVLQGADFDLRLLRRAMNFTADRVFDTVIAARLLGIRGFSLAALVERYFGVVLTKGSQKANWAQRPLPSHMAEYAINDTRYLLPLADKLEAELREKGRYEWFQQSCQRGLAQTAVERVRDEDEAWRISGAGTLPPRTAAVLRALWHWRDHEAQAADRPSFHILQNHLLIEAAQSFVEGGVPEFRHLTARRRRGFMEAAECALQLPEAEWPKRLRKIGTRPTQEAERIAEDLRRRRDIAAEELGIEPSFIAPRAAVDSIAGDESRSATLLVPWQRELLKL